MNPDDDLVDVAAGKFILERLSADLKNVVDADELTFDEVADFICNGNWTATIFKGNRHRKDDFRQHSGLLVLDFDSGLGLAEAIGRFARYQHLIGLTKSHQKPKNLGKRNEKPAGDRFRVVLVAERPASSVAELEATNRSLVVWSPEADPACLHAAQVWRPCTMIVSRRLDGLRVPIVAGQSILKSRGLAKGQRLEESPPEISNATDDLPSGSRIARAAVSFLKSTAPSISGEHGHNKLLRAACVLVKEFCLSDHQAVDLLRSTFNPRCEPPWAEHDLKRKVREARKSSNHVFGYGLSKGWDVRWSSCQALSNLLDDLERGRPVVSEWFAPEIEAAAKTALAYRKLRKLTPKKRVDTFWFEQATTFLESCPEEELDADYLLRTIFNVEAGRSGQRVRLGKVMAALGWKQRRTRRAGRQVQVYARPS